MRTRIFYLKYVDNIANNSSLLSTPVLGWNERRCESFAAQCTGHIQISILAKEYKMFCNVELLSWGHSECPIPMHFFLEHPLGSKHIVEMFWILNLLHSLGLFFLWIFIMLFNYFFILYFFFFNCTFTIFLPSCGGISSESLPAGLFLHQCFIAFLVLQTAVLPTNWCLFQLGIYGKGKIRL